MLKTILAGAIALAALAAAPAEARTDKIKVHGASLEGNLEGNSPDRDVYVFLPPSYDSAKSKRYPVVYFLHGYFAGLVAQDQFVQFQGAVDEAAAAGNDTIVVVPDAYTKWKGAMYGASVTTGDFPRYIAKDLVGYIDAHYRTIADAASRGLSGHSMGGFGTLKIAMLYPDVFSSIFTFAPCCLSPSNLTVEQVGAAQAIPADKIPAAGFGELVAPATMAAWAPDPTNGPHYIAKGVIDGKLDPLFVARMQANSPLVMLPQYLSALKGLEAIRIEVGDKDFLLGDDTKMHDELTKFGVPHEWAVFEGDHGNRVHDRFRSELLPFFAAHLDK